MSVELSRRRVIDLSLLDPGLGRAGMWQMANGPGQETTSHLVVRDDQGRVDTEVRGAVLGAIELDVLCWTLAQAVEGDSKERGKVRTSLTAMARALYGDRDVAPSDRRRIAEALSNLWNAELTTTLYNADGAPEEVVRRRVLQEWKYGPDLYQLQHGERMSPDLVWTLGKDTLALEVANWLMTRVEEENLRVYLEWPVQRRLGTGLGKRIWVLFESWSGYEPLAEHPELEAVEIAMTPGMYERVGARAKAASDRRRALKRAVQRVVEVDEYYVSEGGSQPGCEVIVGRGGDDVLRAVRRRRTASRGVRPSADLEVDVSSVHQMGLPGV